MTETDSLLTMDEILPAVCGAHVLGSGPFSFTSVRTDSRLVEKGSLFVPLAGEKQDGHAFIPQAVERGASAVFIRMKNFEEDSGFFVEIFKKHPSVHFIAVENTLAALQQAAGRYVEQFPRLIKIAVTGSSGKTTVKEMLASILSRRYSVISNKGNLNSETGLPLSVFEIRKEHECGIFEMGMNREHEIAEIAAVLKPRFAVITNIGTAHIGRLGSREAIAREKANVFNHFHGFGTAVIPYDDDFADFLREQAEGKTVLYGKDSETVQYKEDLGLHGTRLSIGGIETVLALPGKHNYRNALAAIALAQVLGLSAEEISQGLQSLVPLSGRGEVIEGAYTVVQDCYNANPDSMEKAVSFFSSLEVPEGAKKILVLGDMLELGADSVRQHEEAGLAAARARADMIIFIGTEMKAAFSAAKDACAKKMIFIEGNSDEAMRKAALEIRDFSPEHRKTAVLLKGSRGMGLERITGMLLGEDR